MAGAGGVQGTQTLPQELLCAQVQLPVLGQRLHDVVEHLPPPPGVKHDA